MKVGRNNIHLYVLMPQYKHLDYISIITKGWGYISCYYIRQFTDVSLSQMAN
jgi:hypothetical protein